MTPLRIAILGSTGRIGSLVLRDVLARGHEASILTRQAIKAPDRAVRVTVGSIDDPEAVGEAVDAADAVIAALGARSNTLADAAALERGMQILIAAMREHEVARLVALSGAAVDIPGDAKPWIDRLASRVVRRAAEHVVGAKQREFEVFAASDLSWTALRPPIVHDGETVGYRLSAALRPGARVSRNAVARALVDQVHDATWVRRAPFVLPD